jgi:hypothetical protein
MLALLLIFFVQVPTATGTIPMHIIDHKYEGCPINSTCTSKLGELRKSFQKHIKRKNFKLAQKLVPIEAWVLNKKKHMEIERGKRSWDQRMATWDSPCRNHKTKEQVFEVAQINVNEYKTIQDSKKTTPELIFHRMFYLHAGQVKTTVIPLGETPLMSNGDMFFFNMEDNNHSYGMWINQKGAISKLSATQSSQKTPEEVSCPAELVKSFKNFYRETPSPYADHFCKAIWDKKTKKLRTYLFGWTCP